MSNIEDPILILMFPRSGSSLLTSLFYYHEVWVGKHNGFFENREMKKRLVQLYGTPEDMVQKNRFPSYNQAFEDVITSVLRKEKYTEGKWLYKCNSVYYKPFIEMWPNCKVICARRDPKAIKKSLSNTSFHSDPNLLDLHIEFMNKAVQKQNGVCVNYENIINGYYQELYEAFKYCGVEINMDIVQSIINPSLKHY